MTFPDWGATVTAAIVFIGGLIGFGRLQQRVATHDDDLVTVAAQFTALEEKMDKHTTQSAKQYAQIQRALGRIEGHFQIKKGDEDGG